MRTGIKVSSRPRSRHACAPEHHPSFGYCQRSPVAGSGRRRLGMTRRYGELVYEFNARNAQKIADAGVTEAMAIFGTPA